MWVFRDFQVCRLMFWETHYGRWITLPVEGKLKLCCVWICKLLVDWAASGTSEGKGDLDFILSQGQGVELANATADCICISG